MRSDTSGNGMKNGSMDWNLLDYPAHQEFHRFMKDLNRFYLEHPAFY